jgi:2-methylcitrate dehydratase PrpD
MWRGMDVTETLASFVVTTTYDDVPESVHEKSREAIRDAVGVAVYGSQHEVGETVGRYADRMFPGEGATVLGRGQSTPAGAALSNGAATHAIDYDDTFESIVIHPSGPVFSAALAAVEESGGDSRDLLTAYAVGCEAAYRVGQSTYPTHYDHGWHATGTAGSFGAAAAVGSALDLPVAEMRYALAIVASGSSALKKNFGSMTKPLHPGHAAQVGVRAAFLAADGFTGDESILDGEMGYGMVMSPAGDYDTGEITEGLGETWAITDIGYKPYPSGVITHAAMDALRDIVVDEDLAPEDVDRVVVTLDEAASSMLIHADAGNALQAKFSIEFCLASVLRARDPGVREFSDEYVTEPETRAAMELVERDFEENLFGDDYAGYGGRVVVETTGGERYENEERRAPGGPNNPVSEERLRGKFFECAETVFDRDDAEELCDAVESLGEDGSLARFVAVARP